MKETEDILNARIESLESQLRERDEEIRRLREAFAHIHVNNGMEDDACKQCGLDLRDPIHQRRQK